MAINTITQIGSIIVNKSVFADIADIACKSIKGVYPIKKDAQMATCTIRGDEVYIKIRINIKQGMDAVKVSNKIQSKVHEGIFEMTGLDCKNIDIAITDFISKD